MLKNRVLHLSAATLAAFAMSAAPVLAEGKVYTGVDGDQITIQKYLIMDSQANVPNVTFNYSIAPGAAQNASANYSKVYAGNDANAVSGTPTIGNAIFAVGDTKYPNAQGIVDTGTQTVAGKKDPVTLEAGQQYARHDVTVDFSGVTFKEPGVYRYVITETASDTSHGITDDDDVTRIMDVYVVHDDASNECKIEGYVLHNNEADVKVPVNGSNPSGKTDGYINNYETEDLTIAETVSGNQASRDEYFECKVKISNSIPGTKYDVDLSNADAETKVTAANPTAHTNAATITTDGSGNAELSFWLQNGQSVKIQGIAKNTVYEIKEDKPQMDLEGYAVSAKIAGDTKLQNNSPIAMTASDTKMTDDAITADTTVTYLNAKSGVIPTGVFMSVAPYAAVVLLGGAGAALTMRKKREEE